jgi:hypothetical protein
MLQIFFQFAVFPFVARSTKRNDLPPKPITGKMMVIVGAEFAQKTFVKRRGENEPGQDRPVDSDMRPVRDSVFR